MQIAQLSTPLSSLPNSDKIQQLISDSLRGDWIVRIEHAEAVSSDAGDDGFAKWYSWDKALFAVKDSSTVMESIIACRTNYPNHAIRLNAEKVNPETRFIYQIYQPEHDPVNHENLAGTMNLPALTATTNDTAIAARVSSVRDRIWRYAAVGGTLLAAVLLLEENAVASIEPDAVSLVSKRTAAITTVDEYIVKP